MNFLTQDVLVSRWKVSLPVILWFGITVIAVLLELSRGTNAIGNYLLFKQVFWHMLHEQNLYLKYPGQHDDCNHYGPLFGVLIAPFALLPVPMGCFLWCLVNALMLFYAVRRLPFTDSLKNSILLIGAVELMTSIHSLQFNPMLTSWILLSFVLIENKKDFWATFFIVAGFLVKLYGIAGIIFFLFSANRSRFAVAFLFWLIALFCLPMLISSSHFTIQSHVDWFRVLIEKNAANISLSSGDRAQDISVMGMIRRLFPVSNLANAWVLVPAALIIFLPAWRRGQYASRIFRLNYLSVALISVVIFSTSAESPTYIIAVMGVAVWFAAQCTPTPPGWATALLVSVLVFTSLSTTDLFPHYVSHTFFIGYSLKALPCFVAWIVIVCQLLFIDFLPVKTVSYE
ncbi:MAG: DUF2029 domain-containing protein [Chitinophagaceae bacterium]|nr:DUF2029 domain-containing protein [Chitinophagaceae bacterium]